MNRAMLIGMLLHGRWSPPGTALLAVSASGAALAAVSAGADAVDLGPAGADEIAAFRADLPGTVVCADAGPADLVRDLRSAPPGAAILCPDLAAAQAAGVGPDRALVRARPDELASLAAEGWAALVDADELAGLAGAPETAGVVAMAAMSCWLGAAVVRTRHVREVRRAIDMTLSIRGLRPPARAVRGLA
jgi:dihydropteroate synthase